MKVQRYQVEGHSYAGEWCKSSDVAELEASHAELLDALKRLYRSDYEIGAFNQARAAIAKAEGKGV